MDRFFDEVAHVLAKPMPRRKAFRLIAGVFVGVFTARFAFALTADGCPCTANGDCTSGNCSFCAGGSPRACAPVGQACCVGGNVGGNGQCNPGTSCAVNSCC